MAVEISEEIKQIINDPYSIKALATISKDGVPHVTYKGSLFLNDDGYIEYNEIIESSTTNKNVVYSIWFDKKVAINILSSDKRSILIKGTPYKGLVNGKHYEEQYIKVQKRLGKEVALSTVWLINIEEVIEESAKKRIKEEQEKHPHYIHLDQIAKTE